MNTRRRAVRGKPYATLLQLFTRRAARVLYANQRLQRWCFDVELIYLAQRLRIPVVEASVNWTEIAGEAHVCIHHLLLLAPCKVHGPIDECWDAARVLHGLRI